MGVVLVLEYLDDVVSTPERAQRFAGLQTLGTIATFGKHRPPPLDEELAQQLDPMSSHYDGGSLVTEQFRLLRANLQFYNVDKPLAWSDHGTVAGRASRRRCQPAAVMARAGLRCSSSTDCGVRCSTISSRGRTAGSDLRSFARAPLRSHG